MEDGDRKGSGRSTKIKGIEEVNVAVSGHLIGRIIVDSAEDENGRTSTWLFV